MQIKNMQTELQEIYRTSTEPVRGCKFSEEEASMVFRDYIEFLEAILPEKSSLLDCGCGSGWSAYLLAKKGFKVTGIDLNEKAFEPPHDHANLSLQEGSVLNLPFPNESFDSVSSYQMLEHVPDPKAALEEMIRVLKPGGILSVVGPNCLGIVPPAKVLGIYVWKNRPLKSILIRLPGMPKHPSGNTLPEALLTIFLNLAKLTQKLLSPSVSFSMREPDLQPPFHGDNDACYMLNPVDIERYLTSRKFEIIQNGKIGRSQIWRYLASGTYVSARKY